MYRIGDGSNRYVPSVTTILGAVASEKSKRSLENWCINNPGKKEEACERGSAIHLCCERYVRGLNPDVPPEYADYWQGMEKHLCNIDDVLWSERPMLPKWRKITVADDGMPRIWSTDLLYSGTPDLVYKRDGMVILADYKTSSGPYCRHFPKDDPDRGKFTGWMKFQKVCKQLAAYSIAFEETLGVKVDACQVIVSTSEMTQNFYIQGSEFEKFKTKWQADCNHFWHKITIGDLASGRPAEMALGEFDLTPELQELLAAEQATTQAPMPDPVGTPVITQKSLLPSSMSHQGLASRPQPPKHQRLIKQLACA